MNLECRMIRNKVAVAVAVGSLQLAKGKKLQTADWRLMTYK